MNIKVITKNQELELGSMFIDDMDRVMIVVQNSGKNVLVVDVEKGDTLIEFYGLKDLNEFYTGKVSKVFTDLTLE